MKIRYYGHNGSGTGYGRAADEMVEALAAAGAEVEVRPLGQASMHVAGARFYRRDDQLTPPDRIIVHTLPLDIARVIGALPSDVLEVPTVAYTTWEALHVPDPVLKSLVEADMLWLPSKATLQAFARSSWPVTGPATFVMPHAYDDALRFQSPGEVPSAPFTFYYVGAWTARKNPAGLVRAFCSEFTREDDVRLLLHSRGVDSNMLVAAVASTGIPQDQLPRISASSRELTEPELWALHASTDVFVSASRGEAWNLPAFEAMIAGRHIIVPAGQGSDEFLEETSASFVSSTPTPAMVDVRVVPSPPDAAPGTMNLQVVGAQGLTARCHWQEPDLMRLAQLMRLAFENRTRTLDVHYDVAAEFGRKAVGQSAVALLQEMKPV